jgi:hypothetical protein
MVINEIDTSTTNVAVPENDNLSEEQIQLMQRTSTPSSAWPINYEIDEHTLKVSQRTHCSHPA